MARNRTAAPASVNGHAPLPSTVSVSRDRDGRVTYEVARQSRRGFVLVLSFLAVAIAAALATMEAIRTRAPNDIGVALSFTSLALVMWAAFLGADRTRVRVVAGVLCVHGSEGETRFELRDPHVRLAATGDPRTKKWRLRITGTAGHETVLRRSQADPAGILAVLAIYRRDFQPSDQARSVDLPEPQPGAGRSPRHRPV